MDNNSLLMGLRYDRDWSSSDGEIQAYARLQTKLDSGQLFAEINATKQGLEAMAGLEFSW